MKVKELIEKLQKFDSDLQVAFRPNQCTSFLNDLMGLKEGIVTNEHTNPDCPALTKGDKILILSLTEEVINPEFDDGGWKFI